MFQAMREAEKIAVSIRLSVRSGIKVKKSAPVIPLQQHMELRTTRPSDCRHLNMQRGSHSKVKTLRLTAALESGRQRFYGFSDHSGRGGGFMLTKYIRST